MPHRTFTIEELTDYLHLAQGDVARLMRESDIPYDVRGGRTLFRKATIDEWASRRILRLPGKRLDAYHEKSMRGTRDVFSGGALIPELLREDDINLTLTSKTRPSVIRDLVALAERTGRVFNPRELLSSVEEREVLCSTALPGGFALLHARHHKADRFEGSFIVLGRTIQAVPFGAPDGRPTQVFFMICCEDDRIHLHTLARFCLIAQQTEVIARLYDASDARAAYEGLIAAEKCVLPALAESAATKRSKSRQS